MTQGDLFAQLCEAREPAMATLARYRARPNMFVSFTNIEKIGINPQTPHNNTPVGVYAYPLKQAYAAMESKTIPFASDRKLIYLIEGDGNMLDLQAYSYSDLERDIGTLADSYQMFAPSEQMYERYLGNWLEFAEKDNDTGSDGEMIWRVVYEAARRAAFSMKRDRDVCANMIFRKLGYSGVIDQGQGIMYNKEPYQAVFLTKSAFRVITALVNDHIPIEGSPPPGFPERKQKKEVARSDATLRNLRAQTISQNPASYSNIAKGDNA